MIVIIFPNVPHCRASDSSQEGLIEGRERMGSVKYGIRSQSVGSINVHDSTVGLDLDIMSNKRARGRVLDLLTL